MKRAKELPSAPPARRSPYWTNRSAAKRRPSVRCCRKPLRTGRTGTYNWYRACPRSCPTPSAAQPRARSASLTIATCAATPWIFAIDRADRSARLRTASRSSGTLGNGRCAGSGCRRRKLTIQLNKAKQIPHGILPHVAQAYNNFSLMRYLALIGMTRNLVAHLRQNRQISKYRRFRWRPLDTV